MSVLDKINPDFKINAVNILTYKTPQTIKGNNYPHNNWLETYEKIKTDISNWFLKSFELNIFLCNNTNPFLLFIIPFLKIVC